MHFAGLTAFKVVSNLKWRVVSRLRHTFSSLHNLTKNASLSKVNAPDKINIRAYAELFFAQNSLFGKVQQKAQFNKKKLADLV